MEKAFATLRKVKKYIDKDAANRDWNLATAMVINGKAGMQFMGDWAKGEFTAAGKVAGQGLHLQRRPRHQGAFTFNIDSFIMFQQKDAERRRARSPWPRPSWTPKFQEVFNLNKGSIPVRLGMTEDKFDHAPRSMADLDASSKTGNLVPSWRTNGHAAGQQGRDVRRGHQVHEHAA